MQKSLRAQIRIIESHSIRPFEWPEDDRVSGRSDRTYGRTIRHPFLVSPLENGSYLLLEEADLYRRLYQSGLSHLPVQSAAIADLKVAGGRIGLIDYHQDDLDRLASRYPDQILVRPDGDGDCPPEGFIALPIEFFKGAGRVIYLRHLTKRGCPIPMQHLFRSIRRRGRYLQLRPEPICSQSVTRPISFSARLTLPPFSNHDLAEAALTDRLFPPRILSPKTSSRVLNIDFPTSVLGSDNSLEEKQTFLQDLIALREQSHRTSLYDGMVFVLNR